MITYTQQEQTQTAINSFMASITHKEAMAYFAKSPILTQQSKTEKAGELGLPETYGCELAPHKISGVDLCPASTKACRAICLAYGFFASYGKDGHGLGISDVWRARLYRSWLYIHSRTDFYSIVDRDIDRLDRKHGGKFSVRLNTLSDVDHTDYINSRPDVSFYDYTKAYARAVQNKLGNYHLTYSVNEKTPQTAWNKLPALGVSMAMIFDIKKGQELPKTFKGLEVIDGDIHDYRPIDKKGVIVGLRLKKTYTEHSANLAGFVNKGDK